MFNWKKRPKQQKTLNEFERIDRELRFIKEELIKIDIKAMEAQKSYRAKLKKLTGDTDKESENNIKTSVFLGPNGTPI